MHKAVQRSYLSCLYNERSRITESERAHSKVLELSDKILSPDYQYLSLLYQNIGFLGEVRGGERMFQKSLNLSIKKQLLLH